MLGVAAEVVAAMPADRRRRGVASAPATATTIIPTGQDSRAATQELRDLAEMAQLRAEAACTAWAASVVGLQSWRVDGSPGLEMAFARLLEGIARDARHLLAVAS